MSRSPPFIAIQLAVAGLSLFMVSACAAGDLSGTASPIAKQNTAVDGELIELHDQFVKYKESGQSSEPFKATNPQLRINDGFVLIDAVASDVTVELENDLRVLGAMQVASYGRTVSCSFPISSIMQLAGLDSLRFARASYATTWPVTN